jgi:hypothetical protein
MNLNRLKFIRATIISSLALSFISAGDSLFSRVYYAFNCIGFCGCCCPRRHAEQEALIEQQEQQRLIDEAKERRIAALKEAAVQLAAKNPTIAELKTLTAEKERKKQAKELANDLCKKARKSAKGKAAEEPQENPQSDDQHLPTIKEEQIVKQVVLYV